MNGNIMHGTVDGSSWLLLGVMGDPIAHSKSPVMHQAALAELGLQGAYVRFTYVRKGLRMQFRPCVPYIFAV